MFLPPYSPDFMPCEELFAQTKNWIRENDAAWKFCQDPKFMVEEAFLQVTDEQIRNYILKFMNYSCADNPISLHQLGQVHVF